jgi:autotransporter-associated beta strand protein
MKRITFAALLALAGAGAAASTCTWTGNGADAHWSRSGNWTACGGTVPADGDSLVFPDGAARLANSNDLGALALVHLQVDGANYVIGGDALSLSNGISANVAAGGLLDKSPQLTLDIALSIKDQAFISSGARSFVLAGDLALAGHRLFIDGAGALSISGAISGAGGIQKDGTGNLFLSGANTYTGTTQLNDGTTFARSDNALGATGPGNGCFIAPGATLLIGSGANVAESLSLDGGGFAGKGALGNDSGDNEVSGDIFVPNTFPTVANSKPGTTLTLSGVVSGIGTLIKSGVGRVRLTNIETLVSTVVSDGVLDVAGDTTGVTVNTGGTLSGTGIVDGITLNFGGTVAPGGEPGTLDSGVMNWNGGGSAQFALGPTAAQSDRLVLSAALGKGSAGTYAFVFGDAATPPVPGLAYTLITFASTTFAPADFTFSYAGTGPEASMSGSFGLDATALTFTPTAVVSDLVFRNGAE